MSQKKTVSELSDEQLNKLDTKRLLALKKSVLAKKSAIYNRNAKTFTISHPFDIVGHLERDYHSGGCQRLYFLTYEMEKLVSESSEYSNLVHYHMRIKDILSTRENIK